MTGHRSGNTSRMRVVRFINAVYGVAILTNSETSVDERWRWLYTRFLKHCNVPTKALRLKNVPGGEKLSVCVSVWQTHYKYAASLPGGLVGKLDQQGSADQLKLTAMGCRICRRDVCS